MEHEEPGRAERLCDDITKIVEESGSKVGRESAECVIYLAEHPNCLGCKYQLGCCKLASLMMLPLMMMSYTPKDFNDFLATTKKVTELQQKILDSKTTDEVKAII